MDFYSSYSPANSKYFVDSTGGYIGEPVSGQQPPSEKIESTVSISDIGTSVTEGSRFGTLIKTSQDAIRKGVGKIELATGMGGGMENIGAESYGEDARTALREIAKVNQVDFVSIHTPTNVGNMSGFNPQQGGFSDQQRHGDMEEVRKAIKFSADVAGGSAIVVHTGEFHRDMGDSFWNKAPVTDEAKRYAKKFKEETGGEHEFREFLSFPEEPGQQVAYLVDDRTGKMITDVRKNQIVYESKYETGYDPVQQRERFVDKDGNFLSDGVDDLSKRVPIWNDEKKQFDSNPVSWRDFEERAENYNKYKNKDDKPMTAAEFFFQSQMENQISQNLGYARHYGQGYTGIKDQIAMLKKEQERMDSLHGNRELTEEEKLQLVPKLSGLFRGDSEAVQKKLIQDGLSASEVIQELVDDMEFNLRHTVDTSSSMFAKAEETIETLKHVVTAEEYAKKQSLKSYAELGIEAMQESKRPDVDKDIFIAPENIFPEMGYGSHPDELIELVTSAREEMTKMLTQKKILDPHGRRDRDGNIIEIANPHYTGMSEKQAKKEAKDHIKATFDTQHLGMWWKHFQPLPGETTEKRKERFDKWYGKMVEKLEDADVVGHIHLVDSLGGGHHHLPVGQGNLPLVKAIEYMKNKKYKGTIISEGHGEEANFGVGRMLTETWKAFGSNVKGSSYGISAPSPSWGSVQHHYSGQLESPYFMFGSYVPSNDWRLWSEVPFE